MRFFFFKKNILTIIGCLILSAILNVRLHAEHRENEFMSEWWFDYHPKESLEFGPLAMEKEGEVTHECEDGRMLTFDSPTPLSPLEIFVHGDSNRQPADRVYFDINQVESVLLFTKETKWNLTSTTTTARSIIDNALRKKINLNDKESAYLLDRYEEIPYIKTYNNGRQVVYSRGKKFVYSNSKNNLKEVKIAFDVYYKKDFLTPVSSLDYTFADTQGNEYKISTIIKSYRYYCPEDTDKILFRGAELLKFDKVYNKYGESLDKDMPDILITTSLYLDSETLSDPLLPSF